MSSSTHDDEDDENNSISIANRNTVVEGGRVILASSASDADATTIQAPLTNVAAASTTTPLQLNNDVDEKTAYVIEVLEKFLANPDSKEFDPVFLKDNPLEGSTAPTLIGALQYVRKHLPEP